MLSFDRSLRVARRQTLRGASAHLARCISQGLSMPCTPRGLPPEAFEGFPPAALKLMYQNTPEHNIDQLRRVFGYHPDEPPLASTLPGSTLTDALLVAVDIDTDGDFKNIVPEQRFIIGISVLDTKRLHELITGASTTPTPVDVIQSFQFHVGDSEYVQRSTSRFLFGQSRPIQLSHLEDTIDKLVSGRTVVVVIHGLESDLRVLSYVNINLTQRSSAVIDTVEVARELSLPLRMIYLKQKLKLGLLPWASPGAGFDARTTMKALLALAVHDRRALEGYSDTASYVLNGVARADDIPPAAIWSIAVLGSKSSDRQLKDALYRLERQRMTISESIARIQSMLRRGQPLQSTPQHKSDKRFKPQTPGASSHQTLETTPNASKVGSDTQPAEQAKLLDYVPTSLATTLNAWSEAEIKSVKDSLDRLTAALDYDEKMIRNGERLIASLRAFQRKIWCPVPLKGGFLKSRLQADVRLKYKRKRASLGAKLDKWRAEVSASARKDDPGGKDDSGSSGSCEVQDQLLRS